MPISYTDACSMLSGDPAPVLFLDTCIILDLIRSPVRDTIPSDITRHARDLCARSSDSPRSLWLATSTTVYDEWDENVDRVKVELEQGIRSIESTRQHFLSAAHSATDVQYEYGHRESQLNLVSQLESNSRALLDSCLVIEPDDAHLLNAMKRVKGYLPPAQRGKSEPRDCEIFELFLGVCTNCRSNGVTDKLLFVTSNKNDYGSSNSGGVQSELDALSAKAVFNLSWALAELDA